MGLVPEMVSGLSSQRFIQDGVKLLPGAGCFSDRTFKILSQRYMKVKFLPKEVA